MSVPGAPCASDAEPGAFGGYAPAAPVVSVLTGDQTLAPAGFVLWTSTSIAAAEAARQRVGTADAGYDGPCSSA